MESSDPENNGDLRVANVCGTVTLLILSKIPTPWCYSHMHGPCQGICTGPRGLHLIGTILGVSIVTLKWGSISTFRNLQTQRLNNLRQGKCCLWLSLASFEGLKLDRGLMAWTYHIINNHEPGSQICGNFGVFLFSAGKWELDNGR